MALKFEIYGGTERVELGTVAEVIGVGGYLKLIPNNVSNLNKRVVVILLRADGKSTTAICSSSVSEKIRSQELKLSQLQGFTLVEQTLRDSDGEPTGEVINMIVMPSTGEMIEFKITGEVEAYQAPAFDPSELVAF